MQFGLSSDTNIMEASIKSRHFDIKTIKAPRKRQKLTKSTKNDVQKINN
jgi:hypothetical protein